MQCNPIKIIKEIICAKCRCRSQKTEYKFEVKRSLVYHFRSLDLITVSCLIRIFNKVHSAILVFPVISASVGCCHTQVYVCIMHFTLCCVFWINKQVREECVGVYALKQRIVTGTENNPLELNRFKQLVEPAFDSRPRWFTHHTCYFFIV